MHIHPPLAVALASALLVSCVAPPGGGGATGDGSRPTATATPGPTATAGTTASAPPAADPSPDAPLPRVRLERVHSALSFERLTGAHQAPDGRWFVVEQPGRILTFREGDAQATVFLDVRSRVNAAGDEEGLLGLALAPDFDRSGVFFVNYTASGPRRTVVSSFASTGTAADPASEAVLLEVAQPFSNHNGGQIAFGPDGHLYVALGDGGSGGDPQGHGQNVETLLGTLLRIDVSDRRAYRVPADNPFVGQAGRDEIWAYGLRNSWRFSFDLETGALWAGDVGQNEWEEVNLITRGGNYGWNVMEGTHCFRTAQCDRSGLIIPITSYPNSGATGCSVTGGFVYRGAAIPALRGAYVYGDYCSGTVWALRHDGARATIEDEIGSAGFRIGSFAQDRDGEIYVLEHATRGGIHRLADAGR